MLLFCFLTSTIVPGALTIPSWKCLLSSLGKDFIANRNRNQCLLQSSVYELREEKRYKFQISLFESVEYVSHISFEQLRSILLCTMYSHVGFWTSLTTDIGIII